MEAEETDSSAKELAFAKGRMEDSGMEPEEKLNTL